MRTRLKVCCISSPAEARLAIRYGAEALGLVGDMPSGPGIITDTLAAEIVAQVPPPISTFLLTQETTAEGIIAHHRRVPATTLQLVDAPTEPDVYARVRAARPGVKIVQVLHVLGEETLAEAMTVAKEVDALLLDSGNPNLAVKELGGTGRTHDWAISRQIVAQSPVPVFLAGGLRPDNVRAAVEAVRPFGVDLCSGIRTDGQLDEEKLRAFVAQL